MAFSFDHLPDEGGEAVIAGLEEFFVYPPLDDVEQIGNGSFMLEMVFDSGSGRFIRFAKESGDVSPGESMARIVWQKNQKAYKIDGILISHYQGGPPSVLAGQRIHLAAERARSRFKRNDE